MSSSVPLSSKNQKRKRYRRRKQLRKQVTLERTLQDSQEDVVETSSPQTEASTAQYSQNWRALQQQLGLPMATERKPKHSPPRSKTLARRLKELGKSPRSVTAASEHKRKRSLPTTKSLARRLEELGESSGTVTAAPEQKHRCSTRSLPTTKTLACRLEELGESSGTVTAAPEQKHRRSTRSLPTTKTLARRLKELGESSGTVTAAPGPSLVGGSRRSGDSLSLDCEMVGGGLRGEINMLARCSLVDCHGNVVYDKFVAPTSRVWDYRTFVSGIRREDLVGAPSFTTVQREVSDLLRGKILVGHDLKHDLVALSLTHPSKDTRDTFCYKPFRQLFGGKGPGLRKLVKKVLDTDIQMGEHNSIEDAQATMRLYQLHKKDWDRASK